MTENINYISINNFWIQFKEHLIAFGHERLPKDIHFTIVYDIKNPNLNFHITKNIDNSSKKPQIKIVIIDKNIINKILITSLFSILKQILIPIDISNLKSKYRDIGYISFNTLEQKEMYSLTEKKLIDSFKDITNIKRKTRLKIKGDIEQILSDYAKSEVINSYLLDNIIEWTNEPKEFIESGVIITPDYAFHVIHINQSWYRFKTDINISEILTSILNPSLAKKIIWKTKRALIVVKNAKTYEDTKAHNSPIRLVFKEN